MRITHVPVSCPNTPDGAHLSEADAIRGGLYTTDGEKVRIPVIEYVQFDQDTGTWVIRIKDAMPTMNNQDEIEVKVKDVEPVE